jgi:hypothetical protein
MIQRMRRRRAARSPASTSSSKLRGDLEHFTDFVARRGDRPAVTSTPAFDYGYR